MEPADSADALEGGPEAAQGKPRLASQLSTASLEEEDNKDALAKYKRLLGMARKTIEDQQRSLQNMRREMEALQRNGSASASGAALTPARILRRCDVDGDIWVLLQYEEDASESWRMFATEEAMNNFIASTGPRLECPPACLSPEQSRAITKAAEEKVALITEEFRRYKVRAEVARKQRDIDARTIANNTQAAQTLLSSDEDEVAKLQKKLAQQESRWRQAYDTLAKEAEQLRNRSGDVVLATQWREKYEHAVHEKESLQGRLLTLIAATAPEKPGVITLEQELHKVKEELRAVRREASEALRGKDRVINELREELIHLRHSQAPPPETEREAHSPHGGERGAPLQESRMQYLRNLLYQYLTCTDQSVSEQMERALMTIFRYTPEERQQIDNARAQKQLFPATTSWTKMVGLS